jgi:hypothetical protein
MATAFVYFKVIIERILKRESAVKVLACNMEYPQFSIG